MVETEVEHFAAGTEVTPRSGEHGKLQDVNAKNEAPVQDEAGASPVLPARLPVYGAPQQDSTPLELSTGWDGTYAVELLSGDLMARVPASSVSPVHSLGSFVQRPSSERGETPTRLLVGTAVQVVAPAGGSGKRWVRGTIVRANLLGAKTTREPRTGIHFTPERLRIMLGRCVRARSDADAQGADTWARHKGLGEQCSPAQRHPGGPGSGLAFLLPGDGSKLNCRAKPIFRHRRAQEEARDAKAKATSRLEAQRRRQGRGQGVGASSIASAPEDSEATADLQLDTAPAKWAWAL